MDKLQEMTRKLYEEGLSKGQAEGEAILEKAKAEAARIIQEAQEQAQSLLSKAEKEAAELKTKVEGDVKTAASQAIQATRSDIENLVIAKTVDAPVKETLSDEVFLREIITEVARHFSADRAQELSLVLPEKFRQNLEPFVTGELAKVIGNGIDATFSKKITGGFRIAPKDGSYFISLTDETFQNLIGEYLRPATKKILFG